MAKKKVYDYDAILDLEMDENDGDAKTVREYLRNLLLALWAEGEGFSGKRPFGNSGWEYELYLPLVKNKIIKGKIDEDGFLEDCDDEEAFNVVENCIERLFEKPVIGHPGPG